MSVEHVDPDSGPECPQALGQGLHFSKIRNIKRTAVRETTPAGASPMPEASVVRIASRLACFRSPSKMTVMHHKLNPNLKRASMLGQYGRGEEDTQLALALTPGGLSCVRTCWPRQSVRQVRKIQTLSVYTQVGASGVQL